MDMASLSEALTSLAEELKEVGVTAFECRVQIVVHKGKGHVSYMLGHSSETNVIAPSWEAAVAEYIRRIRWSKEITGGELLKLTRD